MGRFFIYSRIEKKQMKDPNDNQKVIEQEVKLTDSFDIDRVIRSMSMSEDTMLVLLDDGYESAENVEFVKNNKVDTKRERIWKQSQIIISGEDCKRFIDSIKPYEYPPLVAYANNAHIGVNTSDPVENKE